MLRSAVIAVLAAAAGTAALTVVATPASAHVPACQATQLLQRYTGRDGTAGTFHDGWRLTNFGATCQLLGWITVQNFGQQGQPMPMREHRVGGPAHAVDIRSGQHASFTISFVDPHVRGCTPEHPINMTLRLPGNAGELLAGRGEAACSGSVSVTPMVRGG